MNKEVFVELSHEERRIIEMNYNRVLENEITPTIFFEDCQRLLGPVKFRRLFPAQVPNNKIKGNNEYANQNMNLNNSNQTMNKNLEENKEIKTERLQDIIEYAGVNLKEEQEQIHDSEENFDEDEIEDNQNSLTSLFDIKSIIDFVNCIARKKKLNVNDNTYHALFLSLKRKLTEIIEKMSHASELRVDLNKKKNSIKIENDVKRQLWVLEELEKKRLQKLLSKNGKLKEEKKKALVEREDILVKKRLSNTVALAALGIQNKSWMSPQEIPEQKKQNFMSLYAPYNEQEMQKKVNERKITIDDYVFVMEKDKRYNKSVFLIKEYFKK